MKRQKIIHRALSTLPVLAMLVLVCLGWAAAEWVRSTTGPSAQQLLQSRARDDIRVLKMALLTGRPENTPMPTTAQGLQALKIWGSLPHIPRDPWGRHYVYRYPARVHGYELLSLGPDGIESSDDIVSWNLYGGR